MGPIGNHRFNLRFCLVGDGLQTQGRRQPMGSQTRRCVLRTLLSWLVILLLIHLRLRNLICQL